MTRPSPTPEQWVRDALNLREHTGARYVLYVASRGPVAVSGAQYGKDASYTDLYAAVR